MRGTFVFTLALVAACAHGPAKGPSDREALLARELSQVDSSRLLIVDHLRTRNDDGLSALMTRDAILDLPEGAALWSPGAILQGLGLMRSSMRVLDVTLSPSVRLLCDGAAYEAGAYSAQLQTNATGARQVRSGAYQITWRADDGILRVHRVAMLERLTRKARTDRPCDPL